MRMPWQRKPKDQLAVGAGGLHPDALPPHQTPADVTEIRQSYQTESSTAITGGTEPPINKYENGSVGGYNTASLAPHLQDSVGGYNTSSAAPYPRDSVGGGYTNTTSSVPYPTESGYGRYENSSGYQIPDASERAEMPAEIPVSLAKNY